MSEEGEVFVITEKNIREAIESLRRASLSAPIDRIQPCSRCPRITAHQPSAMILTKDGPQYLCGECACAMEVN